MRHWHWHIFYCEKKKERERETETHRETEKEGEMQLVSALSPVNHQGLHQGWVQTSLYLVIHVTSHHTTSYISFEPIYIPRACNTANLPPAGWPILFCGTTQEPVVATANTGEIGRGFGKNAGGWTGKVEISKEEIPGSKCSIYGHIRTYSRL